MTEIDPCAESEALREQNDADLREIQRAGIQIDLASIQGIRLAALLDHTLGLLYITALDGTTVPNYVRGNFELELQQNYATIIADTRGQIARKKLLDGVRIQN